MDDARIGKYRLDGTIGVGSFATVWLAHDELLDAPVAIKVLADNWARDPDVRRRFVAEAKILRKVDDDRVVRIHVIDELTDGRPYFVMTWADRGTLTDRIDDRAARGEQFGIAEAVGIVDELCAGLTVVHGLGVVHRDLKPSNVLFRSRPRATRDPYPGEQILLSDFGLAKDLEVASGFTLAAGTPAYMAPEQARATTTLDRRADVYSAGVILFELLTGQLPFEATTLGDVTDRRDVAVAELVARLRPDAPPGVGALIERALATRAEARFASAAALADAARSALLNDPRRGELRAPNATVAATTPAIPDVRGRVAEVLRVLVEDVARPTLATAAVRLEQPCRVVVAGRVPDGSALVTTLERLGLRVDTVDPIGAATVDELRSLATADAALVELGADPKAARSIVARALDALVTDPAGPVLLAGVSSADALPALRDDVDVYERVFPLAAIDEAEPIVGAMEQLSRRDDLVRASAALAVVDATLRSDASPELAAAWSRVSDALDALRLEAPALEELCVLRDVVAGRVTFPPQLQPELRRNLLASDTESRFALPATASLDEQRASTAALLDRWRTYVNGGRVPFASRSAADVVLRSLDRLWSSIG